MLIREGLERGLGGGTFLLLIVRVVALVLVNTVILISYPICVNSVLHAFII